MWGDETSTVKERTDIFLREKNDNSLGMEAVMEIFAISSIATQNIKMGISGHDTGDVSKQKNPWK